MSEKVEPTLYKLLQLDPCAEPTMIRYAYRILAAKYHPDNEENGDLEKFNQVTEAFRTLSEKGKRAKYDESIGLEERYEGDDSNDDDDSEPPEPAPSAVKR